MEKTTINIFLKNAIMEFVREGELYCLGLSGGSDSVLLLHYLNELSLEMKFKVVALHLNHSLRGDESDGDMDFCLRLCENIGVEFISKKVDIKEFAKKNKLTIEDAARKYRYRWFVKKCAELKAKAIFIAHHADDQAETVLLRLFRGTGIKGLGGMKKVAYFTRLKIIRPWLNISRETLDENINVSKIKFRYDSSNSDIHFDRNWIRKKLLPEINTHYGSNVKERLLRISKISSDSYEFIRSYAKEIYTSNYRKSVLGILFPIEKFKELHSIIQNELLMIMIEESRSKNSQIQYNVIQKINDFVLSERQRCSVNLPDNFVIGKAYNYFFIGKHENILTKERKITFGETIQTETGMEISVSQVDTRGEAISSNGEAWKKVVLGEPAVMIQYASIPKSARLFLTFRKPGDRYKPVNGREAKVKDIFISAGIPQSLKEFIPIIKCNEEILWLSGWRIAERYKIRHDEDMIGAQRIQLEISIGKKFKKNQ